MRKEDAIKKISQSIESQILTATGASVEVTSRGVDHWTISGDTEDVKKGTEFLTASKVMTETGRDSFDDDPGYLFVYLKSA